MRRGKGRGRGRGKGRGGRKGGGKVEGRGRGRLKGKNIWSQSVFSVSVVDEVKYMHTQLKKIKFDTD